MRRILQVTVIAAALMLPAAGHAGRNGGEAPADASMELIVVELEGCRPCDAFKSQIVPIYQASAHARRVPMRFVGLDSIEASALRLDAPLDVLPTVILISNGAEIARLTGLTSPGNFLTIVQTMIERAE